MEVSSRQSGEIWVGDDFEAMYVGGRLSRRSVQGLLIQHLRTWHKKRRLRRDGTINLIV